MIHKIFETMLYQAADFFKKTYIQVIQVNTFFSDSESLALKLPGPSSRRLHHYPHLFPRLGPENTFPKN